MDEASKLLNRFKRSRSPDPKKKLEELHLKSISRLRMLEMKRYPYSI